MSSLLTFVSVLIIFFGIVNLFRMAIFLIGSDIYGLKKHRKIKKVPSYYPTISVVIPAYNEEKSIVSSLSSVLNNNYPQDKVQVLVANDGSTDGTEEIIREFVNTNNITNVTIISQPNLGKAHALNNGIKNYTTGDLVMCLDADSYIAKDALSRAVIYFEKSDVMAVASNVKVARTKGLLNLIQVFEYIISYQMKKAQTAFNIEYIIGGVGSIFRKSFLEKINFYDVNTVTEDIDVTMKILRHGNKNVRVIYGSDVVAYTQGALTVSDLIRQRHRWKWGRYQTFLKNRHMFFSGDKRHSKSFSWLYLPFAIYSDAAFFFEPLIILFMLYLIIGFGDVVTLTSAMSVISFYMVMSIAGEETLNTKEKLKLVILSPAMYFLFYVLSFAEYLALIKSFWHLPRLQKSLDQSKSNWEPIEREGFSSFREKRKEKYSIVIDANL